MPGFKNGLHFQTSLVKFLVIMFTTNVFAQENLQSLNNVMGPNKTFKLVEKIRRQLMQDNYDYMPSEEEKDTTATLHYEELSETTPTSIDPWSAVTGGINPSNPTDNYPQRTQYPERSYNFRSQQDYTEGQVPKRYPIRNPQHTDLNYPNMPTEQGEIFKNHQTESPDYRDLDQYPNHINEPPPEPQENFDNLNHDYQKDPMMAMMQEIGLDEGLQQTTPQNYDKQVYDEDVIPRTKDTSRYDIDHGFSVAQHDLLYYMDDKRMRRKGEDEGSLVNATSVESEDYVQDATTTPKAKYKMLKVKGAGPNRRKMARRLVEEKNSEGVAIFRLDDKPFPEFLLPHQRRQYMWGGELDNNLSGTSS